VGAFDWQTVEQASRETAQALADAARPFTARPGEYLLLGGEAAEAIHFAAEGIVRIFEGRPGEPQFTTKVLRAPVTLGIAEALNGTRYVGSVEALTEVSGRRLPAAAFCAAVQRDADFGKRVLADVAEKFEGTMRLLGSLGFDDAEVRVCRILLEYARHFGRPSSEGLEIRFPLPRERLAREVGTARRTVDRALRTLREKQLCWTSPRGWQVLSSAEALQAHLEEKTSKNLAASGR